MTKQIINITRKYTVTYEGGDVQDFIKAADDLSNALLYHGLDSYDAGDAVGAIIEIVSMPEFESGWVHTEGELVISATYEDDFFIWEPPFEGELPIHEFDIDDPRNAEDPR